MSMTGHSDIKSLMKYVSVDGNILSGVILKYYFNDGIKN